MKQTILLVLTFSLLLSASDLTPQEKLALQLERQTQAEQLEKEGNYAKAAKIYKKLAFNEDDYQQTAKWKLRQGECLLLAGKVQKSLDVYQDLLESNQLVIPYSLILEKLRQIADCFEQGEGTFLGLKDRSAAIKVYRLAIRETPSVHVTLQDRLKLAELLLADGEPEDAANTYLQAIKQAPANPDLRLKLARLLLKLSQDRNGDSDGSRLRGAAREAKAFLRLAPPEDTAGRQEAADILAAVQNGEAERLLMQAKFYLRPRSFRPEAAKRYLNQIFTEHPNSPAAEEARRLQRDVLPGDKASEQRPPSLNAPRKTAPELEKSLTPIGEKDV